MEHKSNRLLKVCGILMAISGALLLLLGLLALVSPDTFVSPEDDREAWMFTFGMFVVSGAVELVTGILGVKNAAKPEKAGICVGFGILMTVMGVFINFLYVMGGSLNYIYVIVGLVLPVLYLIGAVQNKKLAKS